jgi:DNA-binding SARP family transcriptional activator
VLEFDACEEEAVSRLIQMKLEHGDTAAAIKVYRTYEQRLKNELGLSPSEKIYAMFRGGLS